MIKDKFINKAVKEVVIDSIEEIIIESMVDDMCEKLTKVYLICELYLFNFFFIPAFTLFFTLGTSIAFGWEDVRINLVGS